MAQSRCGKEIQAPQDHFLLNIRELLWVAREWDQEVRAALPEDGLWFGHLSPDTGEIVPDTYAAGKHRDASPRKDRKEWLRRVGLEARPKTQGARTGWGSESF